ncbi:MAG TPA: hypothetical protein VIG48_09525 [Jatrophihabitans sp.]|jgi:hypothetical protein
MTVTRSIVTAGIATTLGAGLLLAPAAHAGGSGVRASGSCSATGSWHLQAEHDNGRIEVEAEVDGNRAGRTFNRTIRNNGTVVRRGAATTHAPSGSFSITRRVTDKPGAAHVVFRATRPGNVCQGSVRV